MASATVAFGNFVNRPASGSTIATLDAVRGGRNLVEKTLDPDSSLVSRCMRGEVLRPRRLQSLFRSFGVGGTSLLFVLPQKANAVGTAHRPWPGDSGDCGAGSYLRASGPAAGNELPLDAEADSEATAASGAFSWREWREISSGRDSVDSRSDCDQIRRANSR